MTKTVKQRTLAWLLTVALLPYPIVKATDGEAALQENPVEITEVMEAVGLPDAEALTQPPITPANDSEPQLFAMQDDNVEENIVEQGSDCENTPSDQNDTDLGDLCESCDGSSEEAEMVGNEPDNENEPEEAELIGETEEEDSGADGEEKEENEEKLEHGDLTADLEYEAVWIRSIPALDGVSWGEDVLKVAKSQLGVGVSQRNFIRDKDGRTHHYNRYGAWYGIPYGDWCAMFVSFCLHYANIPEEAIPPFCSCSIGQTSVKNMGMLVDGDARKDYEPQPGDVVFFSSRWDKTPTHVGIVCEYIPETEGTRAQMITIEGNNLPYVATVTHNFDWESSFGYCVTGYLSMAQAQERWAVQHEETEPETAVEAETVLPDIPVKGAKGRAALDRWPIEPW